MDCIYHAYADHLEYLDIHPTRCDYLYFKILKRWTHGSKPQYTFGGVAPWIVGKLAGMHGLSLAIQYKIYTPEHLREVAKQYYKPYYSRMTNAIGYLKYHGVECKEYFLCPAIYLFLDQQHAKFCLEIPEYGIPVMAIALYKYEEWR
jgi:hypothetical protein